MRGLLIESESGGIDAWNTFEVHTGYPLFSSPSNHSIISLEDDQTADAIYHLDRGEPESGEITLVIQESRALLSLSHQFPEGSATSKSLVRMAGALATMLLNFKQLDSQ